MPLTSLRVTDHNNMSPVIQPVLNPPHCPLIYPTLSEPAYEDVVGYTVESLAELKADNIHSSPLICPASHCILEGYQVGEA